MVGICIQIVGWQIVRKIKTILIVRKMKIIVKFYYSSSINRIINKYQNLENSLNRIAINNLYKTIIKRNQLKIAFIIIQAYHLKTFSLTVFIVIANPRFPNLLLQTKTYQEITPQLALSNLKDKEQSHSPQKMIKKIFAPTLQT